MSTAVRSRWKDKQPEQQQQRQQGRRPTRMLPFGVGGNADSDGVDGVAGSSGLSGERLWRSTAQSILATRLLNKKVIFSHEAQSAWPSDSLYFIFNFFETITPPPNFRTFKEGFEHVSKVMQLHPQFLNGLLLKNVEPFDRFPYLSYSVFHVQPPATNFIHDPAWVKVIREGHGDNQVHHQGGFSELHTIWLNPEDAGSSNRCRRPLSPASAYIVISCRLLGNAKHLEANWRQWSGADFILRGLHPRQLSSLRRISFYRRSVSRCSFTHILLAEFGDSAEIYRLRNFVALINARHCGVAGLYTVELQFCSPRLTEGDQQQLQDQEVLSTSHSSSPS